jgi:hypothetical protein
MSGLEPYLMAASTGLGAVSTLGGMQQAEAAQKAQAARAAHDQQRAALEHRMNERRLERERRQKTASARARLGAAGIGSAGGSGAAVLRGLNKEYDIARFDSRTMFDMNRAGGQNLLDDSGSQLADLASNAKSAIGLGKQVFDFGNQVVGLIER